MHVILKDPGWRLLFKINSTSPQYCIGYALCDFLGVMRVCTLKLKCRIHLLPTHSFITTIIISTATLLTHLSHFELYNSFIHSFLQKSKH